MLKIFKKIIRSKKEDFSIIEGSGIFDVKFYLENNPDVKSANVEPLRHYVECGWKEGRNPSEYFDVKFYLENNPDVKSANVEPLRHYVECGWKEKRLPKNPYSCYDDFVLENDNIIQKDCFLEEFKKVVNPEDSEITISKLYVPKFETIDVSIIVSTYNNFDYLYNCIDSILKSNSKICYEIIIADDSDDINHIEKIQNNILGIKHIKNKGAKGFILNNNNAAKYASGDFFLFLNDDTYVFFNWLDTLYKLIKNDKNIGLVGSKFINSDGTLQEAGGIIWNNASGWNYGIGDNPKKSKYNYIKEVDYISGASIMIRSELWNELEGFSEEYAPAYFEDADLAFRVRKAGYKVIYQPKSVLVHFGSKSYENKDKSESKRILMKNNQIKFIKKWKKELSDQFYPSIENEFFVRDRSFGKKHILIIDRYIPRFDKDAGSRSMYDYIKILKDCDFNITFLDASFQGLEPYKTYIEDMGIEVICRQDAVEINNWLLLYGQFLDFVILSRPTIAGIYLDAIKMYTNAKIFYNCVDFHFLRLQSENDINENNHSKAFIKQMEELEKRIFMNVDCVFTISDDERNYFEKNKLGKKIELLPTFIYKSDFPLSSNYAFDKREGFMFVGGFDHKPNLDGIVWFLDNVWGNMQVKKLKAKLFIVGSNIPLDLKKLKDRNIIIKESVTDKELSCLYNQIKITIAPLTYGGGVKGKVIESICQGVPLVTTSIGAQGIKECEKIMFIANNPEDFANKMCQIYLDKNKWEMMRKNQIEYSRLYYSYKNLKKQFETVFNTEVDTCEFK